jgi:hypothetical protein
MPTYSFIDVNTKEVVEFKLKISEYDQFSADNPHLIRYIDEAPRVVGAISTVGSIEGKTDNTWKEVLSKIAEQNPNSPHAERFGKKTIKQVKTEQVINKHLKIQEENRKAR